MHTCQVKHVRTVAQPSPATTQEDAGWTSLGWELPRTLGSVPQALLFPGPPGPVSDTSGDQGLPVREEPLKSSQNDGRRCIPQTATPSAPSEQTLEASDDRITEGRVLPAS